MTFSNKTRKSLIITIIVLFNATNCLMLPGQPDNTDKVVQPPNNSFIVDWSVLEENHYCGPYINTFRITVDNSRQIIEFPCTIGTGRLMQVEPGLHWIYMDAMRYEQGLNEYIFRRSEQIMVIQNRPTRVVFKLFD